MSPSWRIGEVAERTGLTRRTLRHYDELGLLRPSARSWSDYRLYDSADLLRLLQIQNLKALGLSLTEIAEALADPALDATATLRGHLAHLEEQIATEQDLAARLRSLAESSDRSWDDVLAAIAATRLQSHRDPMLRLRAALNPAQRSTAELFAALRDEADPAVQEVLVWALASRPSAAARASAQLPAADRDLRVVLARLIGKTGDQAQTAVLVELLSDPEPAVVHAAVVALRAHGLPQAAEPLAAMLGSGRVADADLLDSLVAIGPSAGAALLNTLHSPSAAARSAAAEALGRIRGSSATEQAASCAALQGALTDADLAVRHSALLALADLGPAARGVLESVREDPELGGLARRLLEAPLR